MVSESIHDIDNLGPSPACTRFAGEQQVRRIPLSVGMSRPFPISSAKYVK